MAKRTRKAKRTGRARRPKAGTRARKMIRKAGARAMNTGRGRKKASRRKSSRGTRARKPAARRRRTSRARTSGMLSSVTKTARKAMDAAVGAASTAVKNVTR